METFNITAALRDTCCTLLLHGEADLAVADNIVAVGTLRLSEPSTETLTLDLGEVTFMDSSAIGALVVLRNLALASDKHLQLAHLPDRVRQVLTITGLVDTFEAAPDSI
jgi:anti-anti-sigma factor